VTDKAHRWSLLTWSLAAASDYIAEHLTDDTLSKEDREALVLIQCELAFLKDRVPKPPKKTTR
jgi:hypothetical protein